MSESSKVTGGSNANNTLKEDNEAIDYYVQDGYGINNILRQDLPLDDTDKAFINELDSLTSGTVNFDELYRVQDLNVIFPELNDFDMYDLKGHIIYGDNFYDKGAYSQSKKQKNEKLLNSVIGKEVYDKGYMSTTKSLDTAVHKAQETNTHGIDRAIVHLKNTKGAHGIDISRVMDKKYDYDVPEKEVLLQRKNKYKIDRIYAKDNMIHIDVTMTKK